MSGIEWTWGATQIVDAQYDKEAMSIGGGIDPRLKWVTFTDYETGEQKPVWWAEHKEYYKKIHWHNEYLKVFKLDMEELLIDIQTYNNKHSENISVPVVEEVYVEPIVVNEPESVIIAEEAYVKDVVINEPFVQPKVVKPVYSYTDEFPYAWQKIKKIEKQKTF